MGVMLEYIITWLFSLKALLACAVWDGWNSSRRPHFIGFRCWKIQLTAAREAGNWGKKRMSLPISMWMPLKSLADSPTAYTGGISKKLLKSSNRKDLKRWTEISISFLLRKNSLEFWKGLINTLRFSLKDERSKGQWLSSKDCPEIKNKVESQASVWSTNVTVTIQGEGKWIQSLQCVIHNVQCTMKH